MKAYYVADNEEQAALDFSEAIPRSYRPKNCERVDSLLHAKEVLEIYKKRNPMFQWKIFQVEVKEYENGTP